VRTITIAAERLKGIGNIGCALVFSFLAGHLIREATIFGVQAVLHAWSAYLVMLSY